MAKIPLRAYTKEIDALIDRGQYEQALAHCRYILKFIPKHIDTYRLMAKAYLESQRYGDASDVFQRVLSSIPDDFVSQLGMSIIREDEGNLDAAIWHMERAFEIQPANAAIQSELRRLYGRRDGIEPPKIRLTRGALARMYYKGELYPQAINELRAALADDPQRPDLQLLLAQSYARSGQRVESATACNSVLNKLPYCIEANRILSEILENTERSDDAQSYRKRAVALNPYLGQINPTAPTPEQVPDEAVVLERLDWMPDKGIADQPRWATSLGVDLDSAPADQEEVPDWLKELEGGEPASQTDSAAGLLKVSPFVNEEESQESTGELIPEWMKDAGWEPTDGDTTLAEMGYTYSEPADDDESDQLAPAEIPSWLRGMAPEDALGEGATSEVEGEEVDQKLIEALDSAAIPWLEEAPPDPSDTISNWLGGAEQTSEAGLEERPPGDLPDWLVGAIAGTAAGIGAAALGSDDEELPKDIEETPVVPDEAPAAESTEIIAEFDEELIFDMETAATADVPDWLAELGDPEGSEIEAVDAETAEQSELPEWLIDAAGAAETTEPASAEEIPEWMSDIQPGEEALEVIDMPLNELPDIPVPEDGTLPEWLLEDPAQEDIKAVSVEDVPEQLGTEQSVEAIDEMKVEGEAEPELPKWLVGAAAGAATLGAAALAGAGDEEASESDEIQPTDVEGEPVEAVIEQPDLLSEAEVVLAEPQEEISADEEEAAFAWLEGLAAKQGVSEALFLSPDERLEETPEWILSDAAAAEGDQIPTDEASLAEPISGDELEDVFTLEEIDAEEIPLGEGIEDQMLAKGLATDEIISEWIREDHGPTDATVVDIVGEVESTADSIPAEVDLSEAANDTVLEPDISDLSPEEFLPEWLRAAGSEGEVTKAEAELSEDEEIPTWLSQMEESDQEIAPTLAVIEGESLPDEESLDWLPEMESADELVGITDEEEDLVLSDWLSRMPAVETSQAEVDLDQTQPIETPVDAVEDELPESTIAISEADTDEIGDMESIELAGEVAEDEAATSETVEPTELPTWVAGAAAAAALVSKAEASQAEEEPVEIDQPFPDEKAELATGIPEWLEEPEPSIEETPVGATVERIEIQEPPIIQGDTHPSTIQATEDDHTQPEIPSDDDSISSQQEEVDLDTPADAGEGLSDEDAAFAWLETLAVKQGATDALLLSPEERLEEPPEWVIEDSLAAGEEAPEDDIPEFAVPDEPAPAEKKAFIDESAEAEIIQEEPASEDEELPEWLVGAAAGAAVAGAAVLGSREEETEAEVPIQPEEHKEIIPDIVQEEGESLPAEAIEDPEQVADIEGGEEPELPELEADIEKLIAEEELPELPDWLADLEPGEELEDTQWAPEMADVTTISEAVALEQQVTSLDINQASLIELERLPGVGFRRAQALIEYREANGPFGSLDDLSNIEGFDSDLIEELSDYARVSMPTDEEPDLIDEIDTDMLIQARASIYNADIPNAVQSYQVLIQEQQNLPEVVKDLEEALYTYPVDISLWMALGDAQMRAGQLHNALESYNKAEELMS